MPLLPPFNVTYDAPPAPPGWRYYYLVGEDRSDGKTCWNLYSAMARTEEELRERALRDFPNLNILGVYTDQQKAREHIDRRQTCRSNG